MHRGFVPITLARVRDDARSAGRRPQERGDLTPPQPLVTVERQPRSELREEERRLLVRVKERFTERDGILPLRARSMLREVLTQPLVHQAFRA